MSSNLKRCHGLDRVLVLIFSMLQCRIEPGMSYRARSMPKENMRCKTCSVLVFKEVCLMLLSRSDGSSLTEILFFGNLQENGPSFRSENNAKYQLEIWWELMDSVYLFHKWGCPLSSFIRWRSHIPGVAIGSGLDRIQFFVRCPICLQKRRNGHEVDDHPTNILPE